MSSQSRVWSAGDTIFVGVLLALAMIMFSLASPMGQQAEAQTTCGGQRYPDFTQVEDGFQEYANSGSGVPGLRDTPDIDTVNVGATGAPATDGQSKRFLEDASTSEGIFRQAAFNCSANKLVFVVRYSNFDGNYPTLRVGYDERPFNSFGVADNTVEATIDEVGPYNGFYFLGLTPTLGGNPTTLEGDVRLYIRMSHSLTVPVEDRARILLDYYRASQL